MPGERKQPQFMHRLVQKSMERSMMQEIVYERRMRREHRVDEIGADETQYLTKGYKERLKEREAHQRKIALEEEARHFAAVAESLKQTGRKPTPEDISAYKRYMISLAATKAGPSHSETKASQEPGPREPTHRGSSEPTSSKDEDGYGDKPGAEPDMSIRDASVDDDPLKSDLPEGQKYKRARYTTTAAGSDKDNTDQFQQSDEKDHGRLPSSRMQEEEEATAENGIREAARQRLIAEARERYLKRKKDRSDADKNLET